MYDLPLIPKGLSLRIGFYVPENLKLSNTNIIRPVFCLTRLKRLDANYNDQVDDLTFTFTSDSIKVLFYQESDVYIMMCSNLSLHYIKD